MAQVLITLPDGQQIIVQGVMDGQRADVTVHRRSRMSGTWSLPVPAATNNPHEYDTFHVGEY